MTEAFDYSGKYTGRIPSEAERVSIIGRLRAAQPNRHFVFAAFDILETPEEISGFMTEYAMYLAENIEPSEDFNPFKAAAEDVGTALGYISPETFQRWAGAVEHLCHPIFGNPFPQDPT